MPDFQNTPYICWQLLESRGEPIAVPCSCLKNLSWKVKTQFSKTNLRSCITLSFSRPMVLHLKEQPYLCLASGSSICSMNSLLMMSKAVGTGMLVNKAEMSKESWIRANILTNVWPFSMTLRSTNLARTLPKNFTEMSRNPSEGSTENIELQGFMIGAKYTTNCSLQVTLPPHPGFMVCPKYTKLTVPCAP